ncbi:cardiolipin synthase [Anaerovorax odorimutans]|uniref:Cardiolipin synthase n=1 Tax=Anaerovorax odorimutans TaxID=109327 RepID=A0ABT1RJY9_9FIRM|nr:cardiolipin synthase [Anaerovorax odorimutans]MCQ4635498.1 cardiolipin synthase [Anaerovorax odorimutans]
MFDWFGIWQELPHFAQFTSVLFVVNLIIALTIIFLERKNPSATLAWIMILFLLPIAGIIFYFLFSQNIARKKIFRLTRAEEEAIDGSLHQQMREIKEGSYHFANPEAELWKDMIHLNQLYGEAYYTQNNRITIMTGGRHKFRTLLRDIENATTSINIMYFIIKNDAVGRRFIEALTKKAREGVEVRLLMDAMGSRQINDRVLKDFIEAGGKRAYFFPPKFKIVNIRFNYRNHRKLAVIDGEVGYIGGFNIAREYLGMKKKFGYWRDTHLRVMGSCVQDINARFLLDWRFAAKEKLAVSQAYYSDVIEVGNTGVQIVSSGPDSDRVKVKRAYLKMISSAQKNIYLQTPYFVPDASILEALKMAAQSGVDVRIMIPCVPDHIFVYWATYAYVGELIHSGGRAFIYDKGFLHAKTIVVDSEVASVGSANFDRRSFTLNFEANAFIYDGEEARRLEAIFEKDMEECHELTLELYDNRSLWIRFKESVARLLSDLL